MGIMSKILEVTKPRTIRAMAGSISRLAFEEGGTRGMMAWGAFLGGMYGATSDDVSILGGAMIGAGVGLGARMAVGKNVSDEIAKRVSSLARRNIAGAEGAIERGSWNLIQMPMVIHPLTIARGATNFAAKHPLLATSTALAAVSAIEHNMGAENPESPNLYSNSPTMNNAFDKESPVQTRFRMAMEMNAAKTINTNFMSPMGKISSMRLKRVKDLQASTMGISLGLHRGRHG